MLTTRPLIIIPCGQRKVWDREPQRGPTPARDAYTGSPFRVNRAYAERFGDAWLILSAKYGFTSPDVMLPGPYNVTFKRRGTNPVGPDVLRAQASELGLGHYALVVVLGGADYRRAAQEAFLGQSVQLVFPTAGLSVGRAMQVLRRAIDAGEPVAQPPATPVNDS
jgi:hypothetical protein